jgi:hypothetical protein
MKRNKIVFRKEVAIFIDKEQEENSLFMSLFRGHLARKTASFLLFVIFADR